MSSRYISGPGETITAAQPAAMAAIEFESAEPTVSTDAAMVARALPTVPGYRVVRWLGGGGMGDVYEVIDERLDVRFALKMIRPDRAGESFRERFRHEVKALLLLDHPHIARIYSHNEIDGWPYFTMKYACGGTLADRRDDFVGKPEQAAALLAKVADAVDYLHRQGKVHRDLKPSNILFDDRGEPIISDFGLVKDIAVGGTSVVPANQIAIADTSVVSPTDDTASFLADGGGGITRTGAAIGTIAYMSPEQARGDKGAVGPATDIWALGIILFELLAGDRPDLTITPVESLVGFDQLPPPIARIVTQCLARNPDARYETAADLAADLRGWIEPPSSRAPAALTSRRWIAAGILALVCIALIVAAVRRGGDPGSVAPTPAPTIEELRREAITRMAAGETVTLIDRDGNAAPFVQLVVGEKFSRSSRESGGWWGLHSTDAALAEFLDDPGMDSFTLTGEVRGVRTIGLPTAGLFVGHRRIADTSGNWDFQVEYGYKESLGNHLTPPAPIGPGDKLVDPKDVVLANDRDVRRALRLFGAAYDGRGSAPATVFARPMTSDRPTIDGPWRILEVRVNGAAFATGWEGNLEFSTGQLPLWMVEGVQDSLQVRPVPPLTFSARGGLGVYVYGGSASFRNVTIRSGTPSP
jgi:Protein kinase domain